MIDILGFQFDIFQIIVAVFGIGVLVFVHELGHFILAKLFRLPVERFSFGFGKEIAGYTYKETRYSICVIPLGGMVKLPGENVDTAEGTPDEFLSQKWYKRLLIAVAGPLMNYLLAIFIFAFVVVNWGIPEPNELAVIGDVVASYPASEAGFTAGDRILSIDSKNIEKWNEMAKIIHKSADKKLKIKYLRDNREFTAYITPKKDEASGNGLIGISPGVIMTDTTFKESFKYGYRMVIFQSVYTLVYLGKKVSSFERPDIAGPIGVIQIIAKTARSGWNNILGLLATISTALGLFNLLPIPLLDGGHIFMSLIEGVTRRKLNKKFIQASNVFGLGIIILIFLVATYNDILRTFN